MSNRQTYAARYVPHEISAPPHQPDAVLCKAIQQIVKTGVNVNGRTKEGYRCLNGMLLTYVADPFPALFLKKVHWKSVVVELLWFLRGDTNVGFLREHGVTIWDEWAAEESGDLGPIYGKQWREWQGRFNTVDQLAKLERDIHDSVETGRHNRRMLVSAWNTAQLGEMALPPCHFAFQCHVTAGVLDVTVYQRSADMFLGVPFNMASYALLCNILAYRHGLTAGKINHFLGDAHLYENHVEPFAELEARFVEVSELKYPTLVMSPKVRNAKWEDMQPGWFTLEGYTPMPPIKAAIAV